MWIKCPFCDGKGGYGEKSEPAPRISAADRQDFAAQLADSMQARGLSKSAVARMIWGTVRDPRGYPVAKNRDRIAVYLHGTGYPSSKTMLKLSQAGLIDPTKVVLPY